MTMKQQESEPAGGQTSAPEILERLVQQAERAGASDIHLHKHGSAAAVALSEVVKLAK